MSLDLNHLYTSLKSCLLRCVWPAWTVTGKGRFLTCYMCLNIVKLLCFHTDQQLRVLVWVVKNSPANPGDIQEVSLIPGWERSPGGGHGDPLQYSCLENPMDSQRSLVGYSPWGREESDTTERLHFHLPALEKEMATHSSVLAWRIPGTGEPGGLSMGSHRVGHDWSDLAVAAAGIIEKVTIWANMRMR